jgi:hypothetical protein
VLSPRPCVSPDISPYAEVHRWLQEMEEHPHGSSNEVADNLSMLDLAGGHGESSVLRLSERTPIQWRTYQMLIRKEDSLDDDDSASTVPLDPSFIDVFGLKIMWADILPQPKEKGVFDLRFVGYCPPFSRANIQA